MVSYVQRKSWPHLNRLIGSNSQPDPADGHEGKSSAGNVTRAWTDTGTTASTCRRAKRRMCRPGCTILVGRRPSGTVAATPARPQTAMVAKDDDVGSHNLTMPNRSNILNGECQRRARRAPHTNFDTEVE